MSRFVVISTLVWLVAISSFAVGAPRPAEARAFPQVISLPDGWLPEGIEVGRGPELFPGSRAHGGIYVANLVTGEGRVLFAGEPGRVAVGLAFDRRTNYIYAAGGPNGDVHVYDADTGEHIAGIQLAEGADPTFVNDAVVTRDGVYLTDSQRPVLYRVPLGHGGALSDPAEVEVLPLTGDYVHTAGFNANGIDATPSGKSLVIVQSNTGLLFRVDPDTGETTQIDLGGPTVTNGDGILLQGRKLYVMRNQQELIAVIDLARDLSSGEIVEQIDLNDPPELFETPTTLAKFGRRLYAVNARFTTPPTPTTTYTVVMVDR